MRRAVKLQSSPALLFLTQHAGSQSTLAFTLHTNAGYTRCCRADWVRCLLKHCLSLHEDKFYHGTRMCVFLDLLQIT